MLSEIQLKMTFDAGHRVVGHGGKCARLHGHTYRVEVTAVGPVRDPGFVADFGDIKDLINKWDHQMLIWAEDPFVDQVFSQKGLNTKEMGIFYLPFNPTAENMAKYLAQKIGITFDLMETSVTLWETAGCNATYIHRRDSVSL